MFIVPTVFAGSVDIIAVKTDTMPEYDNVGWSDTIVPNSNSTYFTKYYPKPDKYIYLQLQVNGKFGSPIRICNGSSASSPVLLEVSSVCNGIIECKVPVTPGTPEHPIMSGSGNDVFFGMDFDVWAWQEKTTTAKAERKLRVQWHW